MKDFTIRSETERIIIRPLKRVDYRNWLNEFESRFPSQNRHDKGRIDMSECTEEWFANLVAKHQELALNDKAHIFGIFRKEDNKHLGMIDFSTLSREKFSMGKNRLHNT
ncbi:putative nucleotidyltransferase [Peribacillus deserti]|uniref:Nucleotidyltransferase n=1 Tax=Peribacillus deserti TaxID=673318 RepID=A0ABS2QNM7_9BACI|nr:putative nucleotidyltransferase [Peribacillus deserti]